MAKDTRLKAKSDYSLLRKRHKKIADGTIFENDIFTISKMDDLFSDQIPISSDANFNFSYRGGLTAQKKRHRGNWDTNDSGATVDDGIQTSESTIKLNPDYTSLADFVYFGSSLDMFHAVLNKVSQDFPGELYFTGYAEIINGNIFYLISNDYEINVYDDKLSSYNNQSVDTENKLRYFSTSLRSYCRIDSDGNVVNFDEYSGGTLWSVEHFEPSCIELKNGAFVAKVTIMEDIDIYVWSEDGVQTLYYVDESLNNTRIRPQVRFIEEFYNNLSPFENVLLNRKTNPLFRAKFLTTYETEAGPVSEMLSYTWPSSYDYSPKVSGIDFESYVQSMIELCTYFDETSGDNIWRKMTHESIKDLDWTFLRLTGDDVEDLSNIDATRIEAMCKLYGRNYDDIKMYIDSIKTAGNITYNKMGNMPDYCLSDTLELHGFEAIPLNITNDKTFRTDSIYPGERTGYTSSETNIEFFRRLALNSKHIFSVKGTRRSIDEILAIFGFMPDEYEVNEYVVVASGRSDYEHFDGTSGSSVDYPLLDDIQHINQYRDGIYTAPYGSEESENGIYGLPLAAMPIVDEDGNENYYVIPWFSKNNFYDGNLYFQEFGGWGKVSTKKINLSIAPNISEIKSDNNFQIYSETIPPLKFAKTLNDLQSIRNNTLKTGDICYVTDISNILDAYEFMPGDNTEKEAFIEGKNSNYFILENVEYSSCVGYFDSMIDGTAIYGWRCILEEEYNTTEDQLTECGRKVIYYESIIDDMTGNNPHGGHDMYDQGKEYVEAMTKPFRHASKYDEFSWFNDEDAVKFIDYGFTPVWYKDNRKCWYFNDTYNTGNIFVENKNYNDDNVREEYENYDFNQEITDGTFAEQFTEEFN